MYLAKGQIRFVQIQGTIIRIIKPTNRRCLPLIGNTQYLQPHYLFVQTGFVFKIIVPLPSIDFEVESLFQRYCSSNSCINGTEHKSTSVLIVLLP
jgi:hypothetical protein